MVENAARVHRFSCQAVHRLQVAIPDGFYTLCFRLPTQVANSAKHRPNRGQVVHLPTLEQPLCRAEFNTGDDLAVDRAGAGRSTLFTWAGQGEHLTGRDLMPKEVRPSGQYWWRSP